MNRAEALAAAREHVDKMATNVRGYQDGVKLADKVDAVERFARFLLGPENGDLTARMADFAQRIAALESADTVDVRSMADAGHVPLPGGARKVDDGADHPWLNPQIP